MGLSGLVLSLCVWREGVAAWAGTTLNTDNGRPVQLVMVTLDTGAQCRLLLPLTQPQQHEKRKTPSH